MKLILETDELYLPFKRAKIALYGELSYKGRKYAWETFHIFYIKAS